MMLMLAGCARLSVEVARDQARSLARDGGWVGTLHQTPDFDILTYQSANFRRTELLTVVIEGDGRSWLRRNQPSADPTPVNPVGLHLALGLQGNAVYIARPCQFVTGVQRRNCAPVIWTNARFSPEVIRSVNTVIDQIKAQTNAQTLRITGFSGGGTLAALLAIERTDVAQLITIAAPLDIDDWADHHGVSKLRHSRNPADQILKLAEIPQVHIVGADDNVVPARLSEAFIARMPAGHKARLIRIASADHTCCWPQDLLQTVD